MKGEVFPLKIRWRLFSYLIIILFSPSAKKKRKEEIKWGKNWEETLQEKLEGALLLFLYLLPQHLFPQVQYKVMFAQDYSWGIEFPRTYLLYGQLLF